MKRLSPQLPHVWQALIDSLPTAVAYIPLGVAWGLLSQKAGLPPLWGVLYSIFVYAGIVQLLAVSLLVAGFSIPAILLTVLPISLRSSVYVVTTMDRLPSNWLLRLYSSYGMGDMAFAIFTNKKREQASKSSYSFPLVFFIHSYWVIGTIIGVSGGDYMPNNLSCLQFSLPALLTILALEQHRKIGSFSIFLTTLLIAAVYWIALGDNWLLPSILSCALLAFITPDEESE